MVAEEPQEEEQVMSYAQSPRYGALIDRQYSGRLNGLGFAQSRRYPPFIVPQYRGRLSGLGQTTTTKPGSPTVDNTAQDWSTALTTGGTILSSIIGAATGNQAAATAAATATPAVDPATATAPAVSASPSWYWPVVIGFGVAVLGGIGYMSWNVKGPVRSNRGRRRSLRRNTIDEYLRSHPARARFRDHIYMIPGESAHAQRAWDQKYARLKKAAEAEEMRDSPRRKRSSRRRRAA